MTEARRSEDWHHTSLLATLLHNSTVTKKKDAVGRFHYHPFREEIEAEIKRQEAKKVQVKHSIDILKALLPKSEQRRVEKLEKRKSKP